MPQLVLSDEEKDKITKRIIELEEEAKEAYIEHTDWSYIIECLDKEEQIEYWKLNLKLYPEGVSAKTYLKRLGVSDAEINQ